MEKNLDYVRQKDMQHRAKILGMGGDPDDVWSVGQEYQGIGGKKRGRGVGRRVEQSKLGIGAARVEAENTSVYVAGLPQSTTWAQMDLLFSPYGRVKKIKVYRDDGGKPKGDALVTYVKQGSVATAIQKLDGHEISPGTAIQVSPASFSHKDHAIEEEVDADGRVDGADGDNYAHLGEGPGQAGSGYDHDIGEDGESNAPQDIAAVEVLVGPLRDEDFDEDGVPRFKPLPAECRPEECPTCVLRNVYTAEQAANSPSFLDELEAEILMECIQFGSVVCVVTPSEPYYVGAVCVTFETIQSAQHCGEVMDGRFFDFRTMKVQALGNWGQGNIIPEEPVSAKSPQGGGHSAPATDATTAAAHEAAAPADLDSAQEKADPLAAFLMSV